MFLYLAMIDSDADKSKFEILYSEYKNLMYYTANRILCNSSDTEDVVHQAFLKVIEILFLHQGVTKRVRCSSLLPSTKQSTCTAKSSAAMSCRLPRNILELRLPPRSSVSPRATHWPPLSRPCRRVTARYCSCGTTAAIPTRRLRIFWIRPSRTCASSSSVPRKNSAQR